MPKYMEIEPNINDTFRSRVSVVQSQHDLNIWSLCASSNYVNENIKMNLATRYDNYLLIVIYLLYATLDNITRDSCDNFQLTIKKSILKTGRFQRQNDSL